MLEGSHDNPKVGVKLPVTGIKMTDVDRVENENEYLYN